MTVITLFGGFEEMMSVRECLRAGSIAVLLGVVPAVSAAEWATESDIVPMDTVSGVGASDGPYAFVSAQAADQSRLVEVYERSSEGWEKTQVLLPPRPGPEVRNFGVHMTMLGSTALVLIGENGQYDSAAEAYDLNTAVGVYRRDASEWRLDGYLPVREGLVDPDDPQPRAYVRDVALGPAHAVVSVTYNVFADGNFVRTDFVLSFDRRGEEWVFRQRIPLPDPAEGEDAWVSFGFDLDLTDETLAISTVPYGLNTRGQTFGSVYVYDLDIPLAGEPPRWTLDRRIEQDSGYGNATFGQQVDLVGDRLLITASSFNSNPSSGGRAAYLFRRDESGSWQDDTVFRSGDSVLTGYAAELPPPFQAEPFDVDGAALTGSSLFIHARRAALLLTDEGSGWELDTRFLPTERVYAYSSQSFSQVAVAGPSVLFTSYENLPASEGTGVSLQSSLIVFELECSAERTIADNRWAAISPPCLSSAGDVSVAELFADDVGEDAAYASDWAVFRFDETVYDYALVPADQPLERGVGYWIIQVTGAAVTLDLPDGTRPSTVTLRPNEAGCADTANGCIGAPLADFGTVRNGYRLSGNPFNTFVDVDDLRLTAENDVCRTGCTLSEAAQAEIALDTLYGYSTGPDYDRLTSGNRIGPWDAFWMGTFAETNDQGPVLVFPEATR